MDVGDNMNIRKMVILLICLIIIYVGFQLGFQSVNHGHEVDYVLKTDDLKININEKYIQKYKNEKSNYYFEIDTGRNLFNYQTYYNFKRRNYVIKEIMHYEDDEYECIYPIFKVKDQISDAICISNGIQYNAREIDASGVTNFVNSISEEYYYKSSFEQDFGTSKEFKGVTVYKNNFIKGHYLFLENYKGIYLINEDNILENIELFKRDIYSRKINTLVSNYYLTADYDETHSFNVFKVIDIKSGKEKEIISDNSIELDSYIMGSVDMDAYLFDINTKEQYRINVKNKTIKKIGTTSKGIQVYNNSEFQDASAYDASKNNIYFNQYTVDVDFNGTKYARVDKVGNELSGYYYLYEKVKNKYRVYRVNVQNNDIKTYLFDTTDIINIYYKDNYIYYKNNDNVNYYSDITGIRTIFKNTEFEFNSDLKFGVYFE